MMRFSTCGTVHLCAVNTYICSNRSTPLVQGVAEVVWAKIYLLKSHHCPDD